MATIVVGENSYVTVSEAETYGTDRGYTFVQDVSVMLILAMDVLNSKSELWSGSKTDENQDLDFPRNGATAVPAKIKQAQIVIAMEYDKGNDLLAPTEQAVKKEVVGPIETEYMEGYPTSTQYKYIDSLIGSYLSTSATSGANTFELSFAGG